MNTRPTAQLARRLLRVRPPTTPYCRCFRASSCRRSPTPTNPSTQSAQWPQLAKGSLLLAGVGLFSAAAFFHASVVSLDAPSSPNDDEKDAQLPRFRLSEIRKHDASSSNPWVIRGDKVYDITEWIPAHPGGEVILRAAGGPIDRYWDIFSIHKTQYVYDILSHYHIGYVDPADLTADGKKLAVDDEIEDPFSGDPERHADLITLSSKPRNAETPGTAISDNFLTPNDLFYVRNHMWVPTVDDPDQHTLTVELADGTTKTYTLAELKKRFPRRTITAVLQCSGNRRDDMSKGSNRPTNGLPWKTGAISNAAWEGVLLADVLADAGFDAAADEDVRHVHFSGMEAYGASIPIRKAIDPRGDVLLAWGMNGQPLPRDHGFPLRSIVPGHVAARSVKWLKHVTLSEEESTSQWQRRDYKCFGPNQTDVDWDTAPAIQEMPVQSAITSVQLDDSRDSEKPSGNQESVKGRPVSLTGYAYSGGGRAIVRVDVSLDGGSTWSQARLMPDSKESSSQSAGSASWAWKRWRYDGIVPDSLLQPQSSDTANDQNASAAKPRKACTTFVVKATDESYNTQPQSHAATWNVRGNLATAWHRVRICADCSSGTLKQES